MSLKLELETLALYALRLILRIARLQFFSYISVVTIAAGGCTSLPLLVIFTHKYKYFTPTVVAEMLSYLKHGAIPVGLSASSARRLQKRCNGLNFYNSTLVSCI